MSPLPFHHHAESRRTDIDGDGKTDGSFSAVSGLELGAETIEYKDDAGQSFQMPGRRQALNLTLRRGVIPKDSPLFAWLYTVSQNAVEKKNCTISLTDETGANQLATWNITNAFRPSCPGRTSTARPAKGSSRRSPSSPSG
ncbi:phage tail protein [Streptomyces katrae]|uniref:phage tail protein n=1 Tax=Streptomyces katrae TaxID=68223 RepID=UPI003CCBEE60